MLAVHLENGRVEVRKQPLPRLLPGFARIRLIAAGICSTDLELQRGYYGFSGTPGHEFVGEVTDCDDKSWLGKRVCGEINLACGECTWCKRKLGRHCPTRSVLGIVKHPGSFREFLTLPIRNLHVVPKSISNEAAVFVEPVAAACEILDQVKIPKDERVAVLGDGKLGLLIAQVLKAHGADVHLFGRHREKLALVNVTSEVVGKQMPEREYRYVVDSTGSSEGLATAIKMTEPRGTVVMKSTVHSLVSIDTAVPIVNEITLVGSRCGRMEAAIPLLASGKVKVDNLISDRFTLDQAPAAFAHAATKGVLKVLLRATS
ncbi:MAG: alcohol dehydrogenase catalytic domain-containing protein [Bryobacteraceae bacterium]